MKKSAVVFFSASGRTKKAAEKLAATLGADIFEIVPKIPYTKADLNWMNPFSRSSKEMHDKASRTEIERMTIETEKYDTIFLGFPIWWYIAPTIINEFLEHYDFTGKRIVLFATSGGSGFGDTVQKLAGSAPGAELTAGRLLNKMSDAEIRAWLEAYM